METAKAAREEVDSAEQRRLRDRSAPPPPAGTKSWLAPGLDSQSIFFNRYYDCLREKGYSIRRMPSAEHSRARKGAGAGATIMGRMIAPDSPHQEVPSGTIK